MEKKHAKRLLKLADFLSELPKKNFDYCDVIRFDPKCGSVGCAIGWAVTLPFAKREGYRVKKSKCTNFFSALTEEVLDICKGGQHVEFDEVGVDLFGLTYGEASLLFTPDSSGLGEDATPKQVAKHIRKFVKDSGVLE